MSWRPAGPSRVRKGSATHRSSIPENATERIASRWPNGARRHAEYLVGREIVGYRYFDETGAPSMEVPQKGGRPHGVMLCWSLSGTLESAEPYVDGLPHGTAKQWRDGELIGTYRMVRGTGVDLWWGLDDHGRFLAEARFLRDGKRHGFEWWLDDDQRSIYEESHHQRGLPHGIERRWNCERRVRRGYPKYWVKGEQVTKRAYLSACKRDPSLPPFRERDNLPARRFPPEVAEALGRRR